jgi:uncharacterized repeat protein (TIGR03803 family)
MVGTVVVLALAVSVLTLVTAGAAHAQSFQLVHTFSGPDGARPTAGLTIDASGKLYGTVRTGHSGSNWGGAFQMRTHNGNWLFNTLYIFDGQISARVVFGPEGLLYGDSPNNIAGLPYGYLFSLRPGINACTTALCSWNETTIYGFTGGADGGTPRYGDLIFDTSGNMYGTASVGGDSNGNGVVFEATRSGQNWTEQPIYTFGGSPDGSHPFNGLVFDNAGNLYGTTTAGGASGNGTVFELAPAGGGWSEQIIYNFTGGSDGGFPVAGLIFDSAGNLYGATATGGSGGGGTVFELTPSGSSWNFNLLQSFTGAAQCGPWASLNFDSQGNLWGTTLCDGANADGNVFELTPAGGGNWTYASVYDFTGGNDGSQPYAKPVFDASGNLYGTASIAGEHNAGTVWEITNP